MKKYLLLPMLGICCISYAATQRPALELVRGIQDTVYDAKHILTGVTDAQNAVTVNGVQAKVYKTGAFGIEVPLMPGTNSLRVIATDNKGNKTEKTHSLVYLQKEAPKATVAFEIEEARLMPEAKEMLLSEGDLLKIRVKALPGCKASWLNGMPLHELPATEAGMAGIYQGQYKVKADDPVFLQPVAVRLEKDGKTVEKVLDVKIGVIPASEPMIVRTKGSDAFLNFGLGQDRLGGTKMGAIAEGVRMQALSKIGRNYKVRLSDNHIAYLPEEYAEVLPDGFFAAESLTGSWSVSSQGNTDRIVVSLTNRLPYASWQEINPSRIVVNLYGAVCNSNWITQYQSMKAVENVDCRQVEPDVFQILIDLKKDRHWGHKISYNGNSLVIDVKAKPAETLAGMVIGVDAGHGGPNANGAVSTTGIKEKDVNLDLAYMFKEEMEKRGAKVVMTRTADTDMSMAERKKILEDGKIDLLVSFHNNAGGSPLSPGGTSTYYRHIGFRPLSTAVINRVLELDVKNFGNIGNFNFSLNAPTEYPNVLVEVLFMSSLPDEELVADRAFMKKYVEKVALGMEDFMKEQR